MSATTYFTLFTVVLLTYAITYPEYVAMTMRWCKRNVVKSVVIGAALLLWHVLTLWLLNSLDISFLVYLWAIGMLGSFAYKAFR